MLNEVRIKLYKRQLYNNGELSVKINGECMIPFINDKEIVTVKNINKKICLGDIVMLYTDGNFKIHRVIKINYINRTVVTKGDNSVKVDSINKMDEILGIVYRRKGFSFICQIYILLITYLSKRVALIFNKKINSDRNKCLKKIDNINKLRILFTTKLLNAINSSIRGG